MAFIKIKACNKRVLCAFDCLIVVESQRYSLVDLIGVQVLRVYKLIHAVCKYFILKMMKLTTLEEQ